MQYHQLTKMRVRVDHNVMVIVSASVNWHCEQVLRIVAANSVPFEE